MIEWNLVLNCFIGILAILNPIGNVAIFLEHVEGEPLKVQRFTAILMGAAVFTIMLVFFLLGRSVLDVFGITIPAFRIAGAIMILLVGLRMMQGQSKFSNEGIETSGDTHYFAAAKKKLSRILVPVAMPMFVGPGTITTVILYSDKAEGIATTGALIVVILIATSISTVCLYFSSYLQQLLGSNGMQIVIRFMGMILCSIAVQFAIDGIAQILPGVLNPEFLSTN